MEHEIKPQEIVGLVVGKEMNNNVELDTLHFGDMVNGYYENAEQRYGLNDVVTLKGDRHGGVTSIAVAVQLLDSMDRAGYKIVKK